MSEVKTPSVVDVEWARKEMERTGKNKYKKDFVYYIMRANKDIDWVDLSALPRRSIKMIDWKNTRDSVVTSINNELFNVDLCYKSQNKNGKALIHVSYGLNTVCLPFFKLTAVGFTKIVADTFNNYKYNVGEIVNDTLKILKQKRTEDSSGKLSKKYIVQSMVYKDAPPYLIRERDIVRGHGCAYKAGKRVYEGNSLYSVKHIRPYLKNVEESKKILPNSNNIYVVLQCDICKTEKEMKPNNIMSGGFKCLCNNTLSFPELFFISYVESLNLKFKPQQVMKNFENYRFDFVDYENKIIVETHGAQHYKKSSIWYKRTHESDIAKRKWCEENGYVLVELDCRKSEFEFIKNNINKNNYLPDICKTKEKKILEIIKKNKKYPIEKIIEMYRNEKSIIDIAKKTGLKKDTVSSIFKKMNINIRYSQHYLKKKIRCINTNEIFLCLEDAKNWCGLASRERISSCALGKAQSAGKHPVTGEKLTWEYVDNE